MPVPGAFWRAGIDDFTVSNRAGRALRLGYCFGHSRARPVPRSPILSVPRRGSAGPYPRHRRHHLVRGQRTRRGGDHTVLALCFDYFFTEPYYSLEITSRDLPYFFIFVIWGLIVAAFSAVRRMAELGIVAAQGREGVKELVKIIASEQDARLPVDAHASLVVLAAGLIDREADHCSASLGRSEQAAPEHPRDWHCGCDRHRRHCHGPEGFSIGS